MAAALLPALLALGAFSTGATYHVDATGGDDLQPGTSPETAWRTLARAGEGPLRPGDVVLLKAGERWRETLAARVPGDAGAPITYSRYGEGENPVVFAAMVSGRFTVIEELTVEHEKASGPAVRVDGARGSVLRRLTVQNGTGNGIEVEDSRGLLVDSCLVHHFLAGSFSEQVDAHGLVAWDTRGIVLRDTEIHHVSGDCFQTDPDRDDDVFDNVLIEGCRFWTGPLEEDFNDRWRAGERPGENAVDTKVVESDWDGVLRARLTIRDTVAHGWLRDSFIDNKAAFNLKEKIEAIVDGVRVHDCEIAFRLRGSRGNAEIAIRNAVVWGCEKAVRSEDDLRGLRIQNSTFGEGVLTAFDRNGDEGGSLTWTFMNNAFLGGVPRVARSPSNRAAVAADFAGSDQGDYQLRADSALVDAGRREGAPATDIDGHRRPCGKGVDIGAHEHCTEPSAVPPAIPALPRGDANGDRLLDISDPILVLDFLFLGGPEPPCRVASDANADRRIDLGDVIVMLFFLYLGGDPLPEPPPGAAQGPGCDAGPR